VFLNEGLPPLLAHHPPSGAPRGIIPGPEREKNLDTKDDMAYKRRV